MYFYFTWTHPKHQHTRVLIKHEGKRFFIRNWSLLLRFRRQEGKKSMILYMNVLYIANGYKFPEGNFISKLRLRGNGIRYMPRSQNCLMHLPWLHKCLKVCSENSEEQYELMHHRHHQWASDLNHSNKNNSFQNAVRRLI